MLHNAKNIIAYLFQVEDKKLYGKAFGIAVRMSDIWLYSLEGPLFCSTLSR